LGDLNTQRPTTLNQSDLNSQAYNKLDIKKPPKISQFSMWKSIGFEVKSD